MRERRQLAVGRHTTVLGDRQGSQPIKLCSIFMANNTATQLGGAGAGSPRAGPAAGLAPTRPRRNARARAASRPGRDGRGAGSGLRDKSSEPPIKFRVATWNVGSLAKRGSEVVETLETRRVDVCGIQEHRFKGALRPNQCKFITGKTTRYKFFWCAQESGQGGTGILLAEKWVNYVAEVKRISDRIIVLKLIVGKATYSLISVYAPQASLPAADKDRFYDQPQSTVALLPASETKIVVGDWNGHVGADAGVYGAAHGGQGFGTRNTEGERVLEFAVANDMRVGNTWFKKRDSHLITYTSGGHATQLDLILYPKPLSSSVKDVKVIPQQEVVQQHHLVVCELIVRIPRVKKHSFVPRIRTWRLRDPTVASQFQEILKLKVAAQSEQPADGDQVEQLWKKLKDPMLEAAKESCGMSKNHQWKPETWWWNERVTEAVETKRSRFKAFNALKKQGLGESDAGKEARAAYTEAKRLAKQVVWLAKSEAEKEVFAEVSANGDNVFRIAKQIDRTNQDVVGEPCVRNDAGALALTDEEKMAAWAEHYSRLLNVEFEWPRDELPDVDPVQGPPPSVSAELIRKALGKMGLGKAAGPSGIVAEMLKAAGEDGVELARELVEAVLCSGVIPAEWEESIVLSLFKGKGEALDRGNYRGLKLTDQAMKLVERVLDSKIRKMVDIDSMQFGFVPGRGTTDAIFITRQLQEKFIAAGKPLYFAFVDLEKAFDRVPREVLWWALRSVGVEEWAVRVIQGMYSNARSRVRVNGKLSEEFTVGVGVHQGSVLSPLLFILVIEALSREFRGTLPWELVYADDLVVIADSLDECVAKLQAWKTGMEAKGLRVNMAKTKFMVSGTNLNVLKKSGQFPCAVCLSGVGANSIQCTRCSKWVHKKCSGLTGNLRADPTYVCPRCEGRARPLDGRPVKEVLVDGSKLEVVASFCYLGDMLDAGGGCDAAIAARCCVAWGKFRKLLPVLTTRHLSLKIRGKIYHACVRSAMLHGCETWGPNAPDLQRLRRNDRAMIRWICGIKERDEVGRAAPEAGHQRRACRPPQ